MELCFKAEIARLNDTLLFSSKILLTYVENRYTLKIVINTIINLVVIQSLRMQALVIACK